MAAGNRWTWIIKLSAVAVLCGSAIITAQEPAPAEKSAALALTLRSRVETSKGSGRYHTLTRAETWDPAKTALVVCDVWDLHHCLNAVRRIEEFVPRLEQVLREARRRGVTIIHAPSDCMDAYKDHPARRHALAVPRAPDFPRDIGSWCSRIPAEEQGRYPIDQSDGGEDDDPAEHRAWAEKLRGMGRNPAAPWKKQTDGLTIDPRDYISDKGEEIWSILRQRGIDNVILAGVHTNMCVLGRPFGLRQMARYGKHVVLLRDLTDTMYNPARWPFVSHFTGTDLIIEHIEKFVCPTITSDQLIGGRPFRFAKDTRPHLVMVIGEDEYETNKTLPAFAARHLGRDFRVSTVFARDSSPHDFPGMEVLDEADLMLVSVRRRGLKPEQMAAVRRFVQASKAVVGIRTASHAFSPAKDVVRAGAADWPEFDHEVLGGNYHGHYAGKGAAKAHTRVRVVEGARQHPVVTGLPTEEIAVASWLYKTSPLAPQTTLLLTGRVDDQPPEPAAWTFQRRDGGRTFYTSLGHPDDFAMPEFQRLLLNGVYWAAKLPVPRKFRNTVGKAEYQDRWNRLRVPGRWAEGSGGVLRDASGTAWYRCLVRVPMAWAERDLTLTLGDVAGRAEVYVNGYRLGDPEAKAAARVPARLVEAGELNLLAVRVTGGGTAAGIQGVPEVRCGRDRIPLEGNWQFRLGDDPAWSRYALPAKFAASTDVIFEMSATGPDTRPR